MSKIEEIDEFLIKYKSFHEDLIDFKKSIDGNVEQDNLLYKNMTTYLNNLRRYLINKETEKK